MSKEERHLGFGPGYQYDHKKSSEENRLAELEYFKSKGIDVSPDPEMEKEIQDTLKKLEPMIDKDLKELFQKMKERRK
jgi:hypothetical protein